MAKKIKILSDEEKKFLELVSKEPSLYKRFYFTGGTPLSVFYLFHRFSEDIDLFSEDEFNIMPIKSFIGKVQKKLKLEKVDYSQFLGLHSFQLFFPNKTVLKVDFNYYPFPRIEKGKKYTNIEIDSILDITVNKVHTIYMKPRAKDFIDIFFIIKKMNYSFSDILMKAKAKFDWHIDPIQLGTRLLIATEVSDYPRMIKEINHQEWRIFFLEEARKLKKYIFK